MKTDTDRVVVLAGGTGDLGARMATALVRHGATVRALVRLGCSDSRKIALRDIGLEVVEVNFDDPHALSVACKGAECVLSAVNGLESTIIGLQGRLVDAAIEAGVPRFIPSDFAIDFTRTEPGHNRNLDLRRAFMSRVDQSAIRATSVLNGAFADMLSGQAPLLLRGIRRVLFWGDVGQRYDFTTKDDVADFTAQVALDPQAPRILRIAGDSVSPGDLIRLMSRLEARRWKPLRAGSVGFLGVLIAITRRLTPASDEPFPAWQGMQYMRDMAIGSGKLSPLDNDRYGARRWTSVKDVLTGITRQDRSS